MIRPLRTVLTPLAAVLVLAVLLGAWSQALAKQGYVQVNWDRLDLSSQQRNSLNNLDEQWHGTVSEVAPRLHENERKLKHLMRSPNADEEEILSLQQQIHKDKAQLKMEATQIFLNKRKVLNKEQQQKLRNMINPE